MRLRCGECGHDKLLAFSCKRRGSCPSCGARRMSQTAAWHLLAGDASALPAVLRRLDELPAGTRAHVLLQVEDAADERALASAAQLHVTWVRTPTQWLQALRSMPWPADEGFAWLAGEARVVAQAREIVIGAHGQPREALRAAAYWKQGTTAFHERLDD